MRGVGVVALSSSIQTVSGFGDWSRSRGVFVGDVVACCCFQRRDGLRRLHIRQLRKYLTLGGVRFYHYNGSVNKQLLFVVKEHVSVIARTKVISEELVRLTD